MSFTDPIQLTQDLIRCPSVTPKEAGALLLLEQFLSNAGFSCKRIDRGKVSNLYARWGQKAHDRSFGFNGHTDVVPVGDFAAWKHDPFEAIMKDGMLFGRGATDMKSAIAAFASAAVDYVSNSPPDGAIILVITGDEEGEAIDGTQAILDFMEQTGEQMTVCLVGEPTCPNYLGEAIKIGRRGSLSVRFSVIGVQGHTAYPHLAINPIPALIRLLACVTNQDLDEGSDYFDQSTIAITTVDTGNTTTNMIPSAAHAALNIRFNDRHSSDDLTKWIQSISNDTAQDFGVEIKTSITCSGESFLTPPCSFSDLIVSAIQEKLGVTPELSTSGGTSDARFIKDYCPVVEFGLVGKTMHQVNECVPVEQINQLKSVYSHTLKKFFGDISEPISHSKN